MKYTEKHVDPASEIETNGCKDTHAERVTDAQKETGPQLRRPSGTDMLGLHSPGQASPGSAAEGDQRGGTWVGGSVSFRMSPPRAQGRTWKPLAEEPADSGSR